MVDPKVLISPWPGVPTLNTTGLDHAIHPSSFIINEDKCNSPLHLFPLPVHWQHHLRYIPYSNVHWIRSLPPCIFNFSARFTSLQSPVTQLGHMNSLQLWVTILGNSWHSLSARPRPRLFIQKASLVAEPLPQLLEHWFTEEGKMQKPNKWIFTNSTNQTNL